MQGKTILLVEDEALIAMMEAQQLQKHGMRVIHTFSGEDGIRAVETAPGIDLVLMDIDLGRGRMDGTQAAEQILQRRDLPLIFLSAHTEPEVVARTEGITSYGYIVKNSGETVLIASIKMAFRLFEARQLERQKDTALRQSEERFRMSMEASQDGLWDLNLADHNVYLSPAFWNMLGYDPDVPPISMQDWYTLIHPDDRAAALQASRDCEQNGCDTFVLQFRMQTKSGDWRWIQTRGKVFQRDAEGRALRLVGIHSDVTALHESETLYRSVIETADDVIVLTDLQGRHLFHNPAYFSSLGYTSDSGVDQDSFALVHPDDLALVRERMAELFVKGYASAEYRVRHRDGHWVYRYNKGRIIYDVQGQPATILSVIRDMTEIRQNEEKLRQNERRFRAMVEHSYDAITLVGRDGQTLYQSPGVARLTGFSAEENLPHDALANAYPDDVPALQAAYVRLLAQPGRVEHLEFRSLRKDGTVWWTEATATNLLDEPDIQAIIVNYRDISARKRAQAALEQALAEKALLQPARRD